MSRNRILVTILVLVVFGFAIVMISQTTPKYTPAKAPPGYTGYNSSLFETWSVGNDSAEDYIFAKVLQGSERQVTVTRGTESHKVSFKIDKNGIWVNWTPLSAKPGSASRQTIPVDYTTMLKNFLEENFELVIMMGLVGFVLSFLLGLRIGKRGGD